MSSVKSERERVDELRNEQRLNLLKELEYLEERTKLDTIEFNVADFVNAGIDDESLKVESTLDFVITFKWSVESRSFTIVRGAVSASKVKLVAKSHLPNGAKNLRNHFTILISPDGIRHEAPMKNETQNDMNEIESLIGFSLHDSKGRSINHANKCSKLEEEGWSFESFLDDNHSKESELVDDNDSEEEDDS